MKYMTTYAFMRNILLLTIFTLSLAACRDNKAKYTETAYPPECVEIEDSLKTGNIDYATKRISRLISEARDSDDLAAYRVLQSVVDYYAARPDSLYVHSANVICWLESQLPTPRRLTLKARVFQARAGYFTQFDYNPDSCLHYQSEAHRTAIELGDPVLTELTAANLADTYKMRGDLELSSMYYHRALQLADSLKLPRTDYVPITGGLAAVYTALGNFEESRRWWDRTGKYWSEMMTHEKFNYLNNVGNDYFLRKDYPKSLETFRKLQKFIADNGLTEWEQHFCEANLSDVMVRMGMDSAAAPYIEANLKYFSEENSNPYAFNHVLTQAMRMNMNLGNYAEADRLISEHPLDTNVRSEQQLGRYEFLQEYYARRGDWKRAYEAHDAYDAIDDSIRNVRVKLNIKELDMRYQKDAELLTLRTDVERHRSHLLTIYVITAIAVAICAILFVIILIARARARKNESKMLMRIMNLRMDNLRRRITPHFIYNSINHELLARERGESDNLDALVYLLNRQQQIAGEFTDLLEDEIEFMDDYIRIEGQNIRGELRYSLTVDPAGDIQRVDKVRLPSMALQILVENAFKHGFSSLPPEQPKVLSVIAAYEDGGWCITVYNNSGRETPHSSDKVREGLRMITQTIALLNDHNRDKISFEFNPAGENGTCGFKAIIKIPDNYDFDIDQYASRQG